jgi:hypothetical protein
MAIPEFLGRDLGVPNTPADVEEIFQKAVIIPWKAGVEQVERVADLLDKDIPEPFSVRRVQVWGEDGCFDLDRCRAGEDYRRTTKRATRVSDRSIDLFVQINGKANLTPTQMMYRGAAAVAMTRVLERSGYNVRIVAYNRSRCSYIGGGRYADEFQMFTVKEYADPIDVCSVANAVSPWLRRSAGFAAFWLAHPSWMPDTGLGQPIDVRLRADLEGLVPGGISDDAFFLSGAYDLLDAAKVCRSIVEGLSNVVPAFQ